KSKGVPPDDVDIVLHTHLHPDHVGWNMSGDAPTFPNARYFAPRADWDYFNGALAANPQMGQVIPLNDMGRLELYDGEITITSEVTTLPTPGHTPGHCSVLVNSDGEKVLIMGDVAHHPAQADRPEWSSGFDLDGSLAATTRKKMMDRLVEEGLLAAFCHFPGDGFGRISESAGKRVFQAL
ncbi:MAG TPA: MBL fold metallo-hydrolase, partial [Dehalococcoidia bacterium]